MSIFSFFKAQKKTEVGVDKVGGDIIKYEDCRAFLMQEFPNVKQDDIMFFTDITCCGLSLFTKKALINVFKCFLNGEKIKTKAFQLDKDINENLLEEVFGLNKKFLEDNLGNTKINNELLEGKITYHGERYSDYTIKILFEDIRDIVAVSSEYYFPELEYVAELTLCGPFRFMGQTLTAEEQLEDEMVDFQRAVFENFKYAARQYLFLTKIHKILQKYSSSKKTGEILNEELPITITFTYSDEPPKKIHFQYLKDYTTYVKSDKLSRYFGISWLR